MNRRHPPRIAKWFLRWTGVAANQSLVGDLLEEFDRGRSSSWFWRQTFIAVWLAFRTGLRIGRFDIIPSSVGWLVETAVLIALRVFHVPFGLHSLPSAAAAFGCVGLAMYLDYRIRYYFWLHESELSDAESDLFFDRRILTRSIAFLAFRVLLGADVLVGLVGIFPALRISFPSLVMWHVLWIGYVAVREAMEAAGAAADPGSENS